MNTPLHPTLQTAQAQLDADLEELLRVVTSSTPPNHDVIADAVSGILDKYEGNVPGKLLRPKSKQTWKVNGWVTTAWFGDVVHNSEAKAAHAVFKELMRYHMDAITQHLKAKYAAQFADAVKDYLSLRGLPVASSSLSPPAPARLQSTALVIENANNRRDKFIYDNMVKGKTRVWIRNRIVKRKTWEQLQSEQAVSAAAKRYAKRQCLPWPIKRTSS